MTYKLKDFISNVQLRVFRFLCYFEISVSSQFFVRYNRMGQVQHYSMSVMTHWTIDDLAMVMVVEWYERRYASERLTLEHLQLERISHAR